MLHKQQGHNDKFQTWCLYIAIQLVETVCACVYNGSFCNSFLTCLDHQMSCVCYMHKRQGHNDMFQTWCLYMAIQLVETVAILVVVCYLPTLITSVLQDKLLIFTLPVEIASKPSSDNNQAAYNIVKSIGTQVNLPEYQASMPHP